MAVKSYYKSFEPQTWSNTSYSVMPRGLMGSLRYRGFDDAGLGLRSYGRSGLGDFGLGGYSRYGSLGGYRPYLYDNYRGFNGLPYRWPSNELMNPAWNNLVYGDPLERTLGRRLPLSPRELTILSDAVADDRGLLGMQDPAVTAVYDLDDSSNLTAGDIATTANTDVIGIAGRPVRFVSLSQYAVDRAYDAVSY